MRTTGFSCDLCLSHSGLLLIQFVLTGSFANGKQRYPSHWRKCRDGDAGRRSREQTSQFTRYHPTRQDQNRQNDVRHRLWWVFIRNVFCCCKSKRTEGSNFGASLLKLRLARRNDSILSLSFSEFIVDFFARLQPQDFNKRKQDETIRVMAYVIIAQKMGRDGIAKRRKTFMPAGCGQLHVCWTNVVFFLSFFFSPPSKWLRYTWKIVKMGHLCVFCTIPLPSLLLLLREPFRLSGYINTPTSGGPFVWFIRTRNSER